MFTPVHWFYGSCCRAVLQIKVVENVVLKILHNFANNVDVNIDDFIMFEINFKHLDLEDCLDNSKFCNTFFNISSSISQMKTAFVVIHDNELKHHIFTFIQGQ